MAAAAPSSPSLIIGIDSSTQSTKLEAFEVVFDRSGRQSLGQSVFRTKVTYTKDLPELCPSPGSSVRTNASSNSAIQPPLLWFSALDVALLRACEAGFAQRAVALSVSAQQHAAVYWTDAIQQVLSDCATSENQQLSIAARFHSALAFEEVPIWMDSSTLKQCQDLANHVGALLQQTQQRKPIQHDTAASPTSPASALAAGQAYLAAATGSSAYERFTLQQLVALASNKPKEFGDVRHARLLSATLTGVLSGTLADNDACDAAGMNALRLPCADALPAQVPTHELARPWAWDPLVTNWANSALSAAGCQRTVTELLGKGAQVPLTAHPPSTYIAGRFKLPPTCMVVTGSGDNPCALAGLAPQYAPLHPRQQPTRSCTVLSFGTSDTVLSTVPWTHVKPCAGTGHVLPAPLDPQEFCMTMLCVKNGGLVRQALADECAPPAEKQLGGADEAGRSAWEAFGNACTGKVDELLQWREGGVVLLGLLLPLPEIAPHTTAPQERWWRATRSGDSVHLQRCERPERGVQRAAGAALGQLCNLAVHAGKLDNRGVASEEGGSTSKTRQILATGGGSRSPGFMHLASCVFGGPVYAQGGSEEGAARGAAVRAFHHWDATHNTQPTTDTDPTEAAEAPLAPPEASAASSSVGGGSWPVCSTMGALLTSFGREIMPGDCSDDC